MGEARRRQRHEPQWTLASSSLRNHRVPSFVVPTSLTTRTKYCVPSFIVQSRWMYLFFFDNLFLLRVANYLTYVDYCSNANPQNKHWHQHSIMCIILLPFPWIIMKNIGVSRGMYSFLIMYCAPCCHLSHVYYCNNAKPQDELSIFILFFALRVAIHLTYLIFILWPCQTKWLNAMKEGRMWIRFKTLTTGLDNQPWEQGYIEGDCILFLFARMGMMWRRIVHHK